MSYDNSSYWRGLHEQLRGTLRAVGYPELSETFNDLKYASEADSVVAVLDGLRGRLPGGAAVRVLDVGAGTGYWSGLVARFFGAHERPVDLTALDLSEQALAAVRDRLPEARAVCQDLRTVPPDRFREDFDLVYSFYCLHHLPRLRDFLRALTFAGRSVARGGYLVLMDPILTQRYSRLDAVDFPSYQGNGMARHLCLLDDVLQEEGLRRVSIRPAVSFLLNSNIEANRRWVFTLCELLWRGLQPVYRSDRWTRRLGSAVRGLDRLCKRTRRAYSSSICVFEKAA